MKSKKGFTLIELLVVVAIIAVLAAVGGASYRSANERGRNARRAADLEQVRAALEMYRTDEGAYPVRGTTFSQVVTLLNNDDYLGAIPTPPTPVGTGYTYCADAGGTVYQLCANFEGTVTTTCSTADPFDVSPCSGNYSLRNP